MEQDSKDSEDHEEAIKKVRPQKKTGVVVLVAGLSFILMAVLLKLVVPKIMARELQENLTLAPGKSQRYEQWKFPLVPIHLDIYVFNIDNPEEVRNGKAPYVTQLGPYVYREYLDKQNISFDQGKSLVKYNQKKWYVYDRELSCQGCDPTRDNITTVNIPYAIMAQVAKSYDSNLVRVAIDGMLFYEKEELFMTRTVQEHIWGYVDPLFAEFSALKKRFNLSFLSDISPEMSLEYNETFDGVVTAYTGSQDLKRILAWKTWNGKSSVGLWNTTYANMINGSDGTQFPPGYSTDEPLYFFSTNLCRSIYVAFDSKQTIKGINTNRFTTPASVFQNFTQEPNNRDFCLGRCYPNGILAGSRDCKPSSVVSPIVISTPHFLLGDPYLREHVRGLCPDKEKHGLFLSIEPMTGIPLQALIRLQINVLIEPVPGIHGTTGIKEAFVPVMYFSNNATVDDATAEMMRDDIMLPLVICFGIEIAGFAIGGLLTFAGGVLVVLNIRRNRKQRDAAKVNADPAKEGKMPETESDQKALIPDE